MSSHRRPSRTTVWWGVLAVTATALASTAVGIAPGRVDAASPRTRTVLLVHGMPSPDNVRASKVDCNDATMSAWKKGLVTRGFTNVLTVGYNKNDVNCDTSVPGIADNTMNTSLDDVAREFANLVWNDYSSRGVPIAISAHSMGGLIVRRAITGVMNHDAGFPTKLLVADVVTSGTPHGGALVAAACSFTLQCQQMANVSGVMSPFILALQWYGNPQADLHYGTDWTLVASWCDLAVQPSTGTSMVNLSRSSEIASSAQLGVTYRVMGPLAPCPGHAEIIMTDPALDLIATGLTTYG